MRLCTIRLYLFLVLSLSWTAQFPLLWVGVHMSLPILDQNTFFLCDTLLIWKIATLLDIERFSQFSWVLFVCLSFHLFQSFQQIRLLVNRFSFFFLLWLRLNNINWQMSIFWRIRANNSRLRTFNKFVFQFGIKKSAKRWRFFFYYGFPRNWSDKK